LARQLGDINTTALALHGLSDVARETGDYETASRLTEESLALFRQVGNSLATARALHRLGNQSLLRGEYDKALACYNEFGAIYEDLGKLPVRANTMRATVFMLTGRYSEARAKAEKTLEEVRSLGVIYLEAWNSMLLAGLALVEGAAEEAVAFGKASVEIYRALNLPWFLVFAGAFAGCACVRQDRLGEARGHFSEILRVGVELSSPHALDYGMPGLILLYVHEGQIERAVALHAFAVQVSAMGATPWFRDVVDPTYERAAAALPRAVVAAAEARGRSMDRDTWVAELLRDFAHP
jgi:tetratricopeptide (TPR) repeat protein